MSGRRGEPQKALSQSSFTWKDTLAAKCGTKGGESCLACPSYLWGIYLLSFPEPQRKKKKGNIAEFNGVDLANPRPWHFCFGSQTLLVFLGMSVPLKDIIRPFFFPFEKCSPPRALCLLALSLLCELELRGRKSASLNAEYMLGNSAVGLRARLCVSDVRRWSTKRPGVPARGSCAGSLLSSRVTLVKSPFL